MIEVFKLGLFVIAAYVLFLGVLVGLFALLLDAAAGLSILLVLFLITRSIYRHRPVSC